MGKIDLPKLELLLREGRTAKSCASILGVSESAISYARRRFKSKESPELKTLRCGRCRTDLGLFDPDALKKPLTSEMFDPLAPNYPAPFPPGQECRLWQGLHAVRQE